MALATATYALSEEWTAVAAEVTFFIGQARDERDVCLHVGSALPAPGAPYIVVGARGDTALTLDNLTTETVYARALQGSAGVAVIKG